MNIRRLALAGMGIAAGVVSGGIACSPPERNFTADQLKQVSSFQEIMWYMATQADPGFDLAKKADPATIPPDQVSRLGEIGQKLSGAAARLDEPAFSKGADYTKRAAEFRGKVKALEAAAAAKDGAKTVQATLEVKSACAACHGAFR